MTSAVRFMESGDLPLAIECERLARAKKDQDFGTEYIPEWAWTKKHFEGFWKNAGQPRIVVAEVMPEVKPGRFREKEPVVLAGVMAYEILKESYHVALLSVRPGFEVGNTLVKFAIEKAIYQEKKSLSVEVPDGEWNMLKLLQNMGFSVRLMPDNRPDSWDVWYCEKMIKSKVLKKK